MIKIVSAWRRSTLEPRTLWEDHADVRFTEPQGCSMKGQNVSTKGLGRRKPGDMRA